MKDTLLPVRSRSSGRWGYFSTARRSLAIPAEFTDAKPYFDGFAWVGAGASRGIIDVEGRVTAVQGFDEVGNFGSGLAPFNVGSTLEYAPYEDRHYRTGGTWGFIDTAGRPVIAARYVHVTPFSEGLGFLQFDEAGHAFQPERVACCIDPAGKTIFEGSFQPMYSYREGRVVVCEALEKWRWLDRTGKEVGVRRYDLAWSFSEGLAPALVNQGYRHVFVDTNGREKFQAPEGLNYVGDFGEGLCWGELGQPRDIGNGRWFPGGTGVVGYFDDRGRWVINPAFDSAGTFHDGRARVTKAGKSGYIDRQGRIAIDVRFERAGEFTDGVAIVEENGLQAVIDTAGKAVWAG